MEKDELTEEDLDKVKAGMPNDEKITSREAFLKKIGVAHKKDDEELTEEELENVKAGTPIETEIDNDR